MTAKYDKESMITVAEYAEFAQVYDRMGADQHSVKMVEYCFRIFRKFDIRPEAGLDLCCGTGTAIQHFAENGLQMSGLDGSAAMLRIARKKLRTLGVPLFHQVLPNFKIGQTSTPVRKHHEASVARDLVTCFYDSLNYLKNERELKAAFRSVHRHLNRGGWFIFDMNSAEALRTIWNDTQSGTEDDLAWIWQSEYSSKTKSAELHTTIFVRRGQSFKRLDATHIEHAFSNTTIKRLLREAGFRVRGFYNCFTFQPADRKSLRICVVAQRN
jgi:SAM-dependent methyltransferase